MAASHVCAGHTLGALHDEDVRRTSGHYPSGVGCGVWMATACLSRRTRSLDTGARFPSRIKALSLSLSLSLSLQADTLLQGVLIDASHAG